MKFLDKHHSYLKEIPEIRKFSSKTGIQFFIDCLTVKTELSTSGQVASSEFQYFQLTTLTGQYRNISSQTSQSTLYRLNTNSSKSTSFYLIALLQTCLISGLRPEIKLSCAYLILPHKMACSYLNSDLRPELGCDIYRSLDTKY